MKVNSLQLRVALCSYAGYTLLEVAGVVFLIGLIFSLAQPQIFRVEEQNRVRYVGRLLQTDLQRVQAELKTGSQVKVSFTSHGYAVELGESVIQRNYRIHGITFKASAAASTDDQTEPESLSVTSLSDLPVTINWESKHYQGTLVWPPDGAVSWRCHEQ